MDFLSLCGLEKRQFALCFQMFETDAMRKIQICLSDFPVLRDAPERKLCPKIPRCHLAYIPREAEWPMRF